MKKISYEKWESRFYDVPFIKPNFNLLESMGVDTYMVNCSQDTSDGKTKYVRVFHYGGWYEILENGDHYFFHAYLGDKEYDYIGKDEKEIEKNLKDLYGYVISSNLYKKNNLFN